MGSHLIELPASLYKHGSTFLWDGEMFDYVIVTDAEELEIALADGWVPHKPEDVQPRAHADEQPEPASSHPQEQAPVSIPKRRGRKPKVSP